MHDATHYEWLHPDAAVTAASVPSARHANGALAFWRAATPVEVALKAKVGGAKIAIHVQANHGRWLVECPDCGDSQYAVRDDRRFMCCNCANAEVGGLWRPVTWPRDYRAIEELLDARMNPIHRNWLPGETVADLEREGHGHPEEPTDPYEHARWAGFDHERAEQWVRDLELGGVWAKAMKKAGLDK